MASPLNPNGREDRPSADRESIRQFESRKVDHIRLALAEKNQASGMSGLERIQLLHEALPELDFEQIQIQTKSLGQKLPTPFLVSSMTAGHKNSKKLNQLLADACARHGWRMGVGSQRRELTDPSATNEWKSLRSQNPQVHLLGNLGLAQVIQTKTADVQRLVDGLEAQAMIVHLNPLQECMQPEGTPRFRGGLKAIEKLCRALTVPVIVKETGCGFSVSTLRRLNQTGVKAVDISGLGGTHWGRIEGGRSQSDHLRQAAAETFANWGISTVDSMHAALQAKGKFEVWASGGVRSGLDAAKLLAMGAKTVGVAMPILQAALQGEAALEQKILSFEFELKTAMFCTGSVDLRSLEKRRVWR